MIKRESERERERKKETDSVKDKFSKRHMEKKRHIL